VFDSGESIADPAEVMHVGIILCEPEKGLEAIDLGLPERTEHLSVAVEEAGVVQGHAIISPPSGR
jgi:hypothetical protein